MAAHDPCLYDNGTASRINALLSRGEKQKRSGVMPILLWLLGVPITLIIVLMLVGVV